MTFTTASLPDTAAPITSAVEPSLIMISGATVTWTTNEPATSKVEYGLDTDYGSATAESASLVTDHSVTLTELKAGKTYHYRVVSKDSAGNQAASADYTFKTDSTSGGMPAGASVLIGLVVVGAVAGGAFLFSRGKKTA
jgi:hypothetical protein